MPAPSPLTMKVEDQVKASVEARMPALKGRIEIVEEIRQTGGAELVIETGVITKVSLEDEWFEDIADPQAVVHALRQALGKTPDLFTFWQRMPDVQACHPYHTEWEEIAVLPIRSLLISISTAPNVKNGSPPALMRPKPLRAPLTACPAVHMAQRAPCKAAG